MKTNRKKEVVVSTILLVISLAVGVLIFIAGKTANLENFSKNFAHNIFVSVGGITDVLLFFWALSGLMTRTRKKLSDEEIRKAVEHLKHKRKTDTIRYGTGPEITAMRVEKEAK